MFDASVPSVLNYQTEQYVPAAGLASGPEDRYRQIEIYSLQYQGLIDAGKIDMTDISHVWQALSVCLGLRARRG